MNGLGSAANFLVNGSFRRWPAGALKLSPRPGHGRRAGHCPETRPVGPRARVAVHHGAGCGRCGAVPGATIGDVAGNGFFRVHPPGAEPARGFWGDNHAGRDRIRTFLGTTTLDGTKFELFSGHPGWLSRFLFKFRATQAGGHEFFPNLVPSRLAATIFFPISRHPGWRPRNFFKSGAVQRGWLEIFPVPVASSAVGTRFWPFLAKIHRFGPVWPRAARFPS